MKKQRELYPPGLSLFIVNYSFFGIHCNAFVTFLGNIPKLCNDAINYKPIPFSHVGNILSADIDQC